MRPVLLFVTAALTGQLAAAAPALAAGNPDEGKKVFGICRTCHTLERGKNGVGPSLAGVFGRKSGTAPGFSYSKAMVDKAVTWEESTIATYIADPKAYVPGNKMVFPGLKKDSQIADVIAYLKDAAK